MSKQLLEPEQFSAEPSPVQGNEIPTTQLANGRHTPAPVRVHYPAPRRKPWGTTFMTASALAAVLILAIALVGVVALANATHSSGAQAPVDTSTQAIASNTTPVPQIVPPAHQLYNAQAPATPQGSTVNLTLTIKEVLISIAPGVAYHAWTFNGTVPGPVLRVRQGQTVHFTLINDGTMPHSIDFHAAQTPWSVNYQPVAPGKRFSFTWVANYPGVFMYHCGAPVTMYHMANGMYGAIIVDPAQGWTPAQEFVLVQSEFYTHQLTDGSYSIDPNKMDAGTPDYVVFNGYANQYQEHPLVAKAGQPIRIFLVNAGPTLFSAFHVIGAIFSDTYIDGNPANHLVGDQTVTVPPGGGMVVELTMPQAGLYPFVSHSFASVGKGAIGVIKVVP
jgi:nitrite reductase (NO-forming)